MHVRGSVSARVLGTINLLVGLVMGAGGFLEALGSARIGAPVNVALGVLGGGAGVLFLASAAGLLTGGRAARGITIAAAAVALVVHGAAMGLAHPGVMAILVGVVYPAGLLLLLWTKPGLGAAVPAGASPDTPGEARRRGDPRLRVVMA